MKVSEAIEILKKPCLCDYNLSHTIESCDISVCDKRDATKLAIKSLEMQEKLKQWIEGYKRPEFADMTLTRDGLIDILEEFRLECETDE